MKIKTILLAAGAVVILAVLVMFGCMGFIILDVMSYTATGSLTLNPDGTAAGTALVVYDPGVSGAAKNAATSIANDLESKGYKVTLAGVRSEAAAADESGYDIIVVGGPTYAGNLSSSVQSYLKDLKPSANATVGVFATGSVKPASDDPAYMRGFVSGLSDNSSLKVTSSLKVLTGDDVETIDDVFVSELVQ